VNLPRLVFWALSAQPTKGRNKTRPRTLSPLQSLGAPHPRFPVEFRGFTELHRLSLKRGAHTVLSRAAYRKFGASRSFFARCGIPTGLPLKPV
jgi:hypothetical protein